MLFHSEELLDSYFFVTHKYIHDYCRQQDHLDSTGLLYQHLIKHCLIYRQWRNIVSPGSSRLKGAERLFGISWAGHRESPSPRTNSPKQRQPCIRRQQFFRCFELERKHRLCQSHHRTTFRHPIGECLDNLNSIGSLVWRGSFSSYAD